MMELTDKEIVAAIRALLDGAVFRGQDSMAEYLVAIGRLVGLR